MSYCAMQASPCRSMDGALGAAARQVALGVQGA